MVLKQPKGKQPFPLRTSVQLGQWNSYKSPILHWTHVEITSKHTDQDAHKQVHLAQKDWHQRTLGHIIKN
jgi:hypothetical protein